MFIILEVNVRIPFIEREVFHIQKIFFLKLRAEAGVLKVWVLAGMKT